MPCSRSTDLVHPGGGVLSPPGGEVPPPAGEAEAEVAPGTGLKKMSFIVCDLINSK